MKDKINMPISILADLPQQYAERWNKYYQKKSDRNRTQEEGIWRRTQTPENASESGWNSSDDCRRRIVYYLHDFELIERNNLYDLVLSCFFLYYSITLPVEELSLVQENITAALTTKGWNKSINEGYLDWHLGDLYCSIQEFTEHPEDIRTQRQIPSNYQSIDITIRTKQVGNVQPRLPWEVLAQGMRIKDLRENPCEVDNLSILKEFQPFHVEIGCGLSLEAGVPALHHLHDLYCVTDLDTGKFIFGGIQDNLMPRLLADPESEIPRLGSLFSASFLAEPTGAHHSLQALLKHGYLIEPIMTNNFDGLAHRSGLTEKFLRRYDELIPAINLDSSAKSLLVIGNHADRRRVQARARENGLKVIYLDTEGYSVNGRFVPYPLEGPKDGDFLCRKTATEGLTELCTILGIE